MNPVGPIGRLGRWTASHFGVVVGVWAVALGGLGALAPKAEQALSSAWWLPGWMGRLLPNVRFGHASQPGGE